MFSPAKWWAKANGRPRAPDAALDGRGAGGHHQLIDARGGDQRVEARPHLVGRADRLARVPGCDELLLRRAELVGERLLDAHRLRLEAAAHAEERQLARERQRAHLSGVVVRDHVHGDHRVRLAQLLPRLEPGPVQVERRLGVLAGEVVGEGEREAESGGDLRAVAARPEQPHLGSVTEAWHRGAGVQRVRVAHAAVEEAEQVEQLLGEVVDAEPLRTASERHRGRAVGTGGAPDAEIDAVAVEGAEGAELLGDDQRGVIGEHHAAGSHADPVGGRRDPGDEDGGGAGGDRRHPVVLRDPETPVAETFRRSCEADRPGYCVGVAAAGGSACEVEDVEGDAGGHTEGNRRRPPPIPLEGRALVATGQDDRTFRIHAATATLTRPMTRRPAPVQIAHCAMTEPVSARPELPGSLMVDADASAGTTVRDAEQT